MTAPPVLPDRTATPDDYLLAREPSEFEYDSEEMDPGEPEDGPGEDDASDRFQFDIPVKRARY